MKTKKTNRLLSALLSMLLLFSSVPASVFAEGTAEVPSVTVTATAQIDGVFLCAPQLNLTVYGNTAESYGYTQDAITDGVSALDALVALHKLVLGDAFTKDTATDYLEVNEYGTVSKSFGQTETDPTTNTVTNRYAGFALNGSYPTDGTPSTWGSGYTGTYETNTALANGDTVEFFFYSASYDNELAWFSYQGAVAKEITLAPQADATLNLKSANFMSGYLYIDADALHKAGVKVSGAQLAYVDLQSGQLTDITGAVTDANGNVSITAPEAEGTYYLTAYMPSTAEKLILSLTKLKVDKNAPKYDPCALSSLDVWTIETNDNHPKLSPSFDKDITSYTVPLQEYPSIDVFTFFNVNFTATAVSETAVIKAECNGFHHDKVSSGAIEKLQGTFAEGGVLQGGKKNILKITVFESDAENAASKTYTVTIPMKPKVNSAPVPKQTSATATIALGDTYRTDLSKAFTDADEIDTLSYKVSVNNAEAVAAPADYSFKPSAVGDYTLVFTANDGAADSTAYTLTLTVEENWLSAYSPSAASAYLPAPGQFVNLEDYRDPAKTLNGTGIITLGAFGGSVVYRFDEPIQNDPKNPYGIDFIVFGNCYTADGVSYASSAEPAAVMVSKDGSSWYELAGSEYYTANAQHNVSLSYTNTDTEFAQAVPVSWQIAGGESGTLPVNSYHTQAYYPNPEHYSAFNTGIGKNESYTAASVSFGGTMIDSGFYPFGYADSHGADESKKNSAVNPYRSEHDKGANGDGFDLSWAVDSDGKPVDLDEIRYLKIYNPVLNYSAVMGETSPEISTVVRAASAEKAVGTSDGLSSLVVNGKEITLSEEQASYTIDAEGASSFVICPTAKTADANIYVSNLRTKSGEETEPITATEMLRIIVQDGEKEPAIYTLSFENITKPKANADLASLTLTPGDVRKAPNEDNEIAFSVESNVSSVSFTPSFASKKASAVFTGESLSEPVVLSHGVRSTALELEKGENNYTLTVSSEDESNSKSYQIKVNKASSSSSSSSADISVSFSITGLDGKSVIKQQNVKIPKKSTVKYLTEMMLGNAGIDYVTDGTYISEINGLAEFDKGDNSGWLYRVNGTISNQSYANKTLSSGDVVKWFYTEDYTKEKDFESFQSNSSSSSSNKKNHDSSSSSTATSTNNFSDVASGAWYEDAVSFVTQRKLFNGISETSFAPEEAMTRAMLVTVLYRLDAGNSFASASSRYTDVDASAWYASALAWATENGIVNGINETEFAPNLNITREQIASILYRYAQKKQLVSDTESGSLQGFSDKDSVSPYAADALEWAVGVGLMNGKTESLLCPTDFATRAEVAAMLMRFCERIVK